MCKNNNCLSKIYRSLVARLKLTGVIGQGTKRFQGLPQGPAGAPMSGVLNHLSPLPFSPPLSQRRLNSAL